MWAHFAQAESHLREALSKNEQFRPARSYLVAVLSERGRQAEAVAAMALSGAKGEPLVTHLREDPQGRGAEHVHRITPYANPAISAHLLRLWQAAARGGTA
jgi:hypothetical protein